MNKSAESMHGPKRNAILSGNAYSFGKEMRVTPCGNRFIIVSCRPN